MTEEGRPIVGGRPQHRVHEMTLGETGEEGT